MPDAIIAEPAFPWHVAPFRTFRVADVLKMLAPAIVIGLVALMMLRDPIVLLFVLLAFLLTLPMRLRRASIYKVELNRPEQLSRTIELLEETPALRRDDGKLRWTMRHWPVWLQGKADEVSITEDRCGWVVVGPRMTMVSLASKLTKLD